MAPLLWYAVHTKPRAERMVEAQVRLLGDGYEAFYPHCLVKRVRHWSRGRTVEEIVERPYFSRYIFAGIVPWQSPTPLFSMTGVSSVLRSPSPDGVYRPLVIPEAAMTDLMSRADANGVIGEIDTTEPLHDYRAGDTVRFAPSSPFGGLTCLIVKVDRDGWLRVVMAMFGRETETSVHHSQLGEVVKTRATPMADACQTPRRRQPA